MEKRGAPKGNTNRKGKPMKRQAEIKEKLDALGCDPIEGMARIAKMAETAFFDNLKLLVEGSEISIPGLYKDLTLAGQMYKELAQYVAPKLKAVEITTSEGQQLNKAVLFTDAANPILNDTDTAD